MTFESKAKWLAKPIKAVLLDITGVLYESGTKCAIPGSVEAIKKLRSAGIPFRLVTNETQNPIKNLIDKLNGFGYDFSASEITAPAPTVCKFLEKHQLRPYLLVHEKLLPEFETLSKDNPNCVVVGDAAEYFTYPAMNCAFQLLLDLKEQPNINPSRMLISMGKNKFYKEKGKLTIDLGAYTTALEFATDVKATIMGKPSEEYFKSALECLSYVDCNFDDVVMVGDDINGDVGGAQGAGMRGVLVRTGKFRPSDEHHPTIKPDAIVNNLLDAIQQIVINKDNNDIIVKNNIDFH